MDAIFLLFGNFFGDMVFILKIFALLAIIGFINANIQSKLIKVVMIFFMVYFVLIANWSSLGTIWIIYTVIGLGISGVLVDIFFVSQQSGGPEEMMQAQQGGAATGGQEEHHPQFPFMRRR